MIGDWTSERPYETFSGGEQLRIDYAIRFALAELLAQRAGSKVEWLTIDEGLGSQDAEHRALVLESIKSVSSRFKKVILITHIEGAQSMFDQIIHFEPLENELRINIA
ncbi:putative DNA double-strand break repair Rad50 ATPase [compost metagenome]